MNNDKYDFGMIGLGTMGKNLVLNMSDKGFSVAGFDKNAVQIDAFNKDISGRKIHGGNNLNEFINSLKIPRVIIMLVPAGKIVDEVIDELLPFLNADDILLDFGNSHYTDTNLRLERLSKLNIHFMGVGISGGEEGARYGPSIMPGGNKNVYDHIAPMLQAVSAKVGDVPCVEWMGNGSAGHYVKMVHNGIEYAIMQLISESYHLLKSVGGMSNDELSEVFSNWNKGRLQSFLIEITADIFLQKDELTENYLLDMILDTARQKGTGAWTSEDAMQLEVPVTIIDSAVASRNLSTYKKERLAAEKGRSAAVINYKGSKEELIGLVEQALYFSVITAYTQGLDLLGKATLAYKYELNLGNVATIWRGGCIIRASLLEDIRTAFTKKSDLANLMMDEKIAHELLLSEKGIRSVLQVAIGNTIPVPAMMSALSYYDGYNKGWLPANLLQAQRDYFGAHTYKRIDREGTFHSHWNKKK